MNTRKPLSTVSYNSEVFLISLLEDLYSKGKICNYMAIYHLKEEDETKDHWHVYLEPNKQIDSIKLQSLFNEFDPNQLLKI